MCCDVLCCDVLCCVVCCLLALQLYMLEDIMLAAGAVSAVNLDGGGSSVAVFHGRWASHPTCDDTKVACERAVTSITCVSDTPMHG